MFKKIYNLHNKYIKKILNYIPFKKEAQWDESEKKNMK